MSIDKVSSYDLRVKGRRDTVDNTAFTHSELQYIRHLQFTGLPIIPNFARLSQILRLSRSTQSLKPDREANLPPFLLPSPLFFPSPVVVD